MRFEISGLVLLLIVSGGLLLVNGAEDPLQNRCGKYLQKVVACLNFATGKADTPGKECCDSSSSIEKNDRPVCFCFIIEQVHSGANAQIKSMGIQEARLLQIPSACKINDVNVTTCPKLLNIPANSPDAAFYSNVTASTASPSSPVTTTPTGSSNAFNHTPLLAVAIFCFIFLKMLL